MHNSGLLKHGVKHLSNSTLLKWCHDPRMGVLKTLFNFRDEFSGPSAARGLAVEGGAELIFRNRKGALEAAMAAFDASMMGEISEKIDRERQVIPGMIKEIEKWKPPAPLLASQVKINLQLDDVPVPLVGFIDFIFEDGTIIDLKTTHRCPSQASEDHLRQVAIYSTASNNAPAGLLYVTGKRHEYYQMTEAQRVIGMREIAAMARFVDRFLLAFDTAEEALAATPPITLSYEWSDEAKTKLAEIMV